MVALRLHMLRKLDLASLKPHQKLEFFAKIRGTFLLTSSSDTSPLCPCARITYPICTRDQGRALCSSPRYSSGSLPQLFPLCSHFLLIEAHLNNYPHMCTCCLLQYSAFKNFVHSTHQFLTQQVIYLFIVSLFSRR